MPRMQVDSPETRRRTRRQGELAASRSLVALMAAVSMLRTALTRVMPLAGSAAWWVTPGCMLPGVLVCAVLAGMMKHTGAPTLQELLRRTLGRWGGRLGAALLALLLLTDGASTMTALITLFTEGIGTRGTQLTLALLTCGALAFCLHREGLPRAVYLLRWALMISALLLGAAVWSKAHRDGLHPVLGPGMENLSAAFTTGGGTGWPLLLLLTIPKDDAGCRWTGFLPAPLTLTVVMLLVCLTHPNEQLTALAGLPDGLLLPVRYAGNGAQMLGHCLMMLTFFLAIGGAAQLAGDFALQGRSRRWPAYAVLALLAASQALPPHRVWDMLQRIEHALLILLALVLAGSLLIAGGRRKRM